MNKIIEQKIKVQNRVVELSHEYNYLLLSFSTGVGKTLSALRVAQEHDDLPWLILCKETNHINEWEKEIKKHNISIKYEIMCYHSLHKIEGNYNIICDEAHGLTVKRRKLIEKNINYNRITFLTATLPDNKINHLNILSNNKLKNLVLSLNKAIELGILPEPTINIYFLSLNKKDKQKYQAIDASVKQLSFEYKEDKSSSTYEKLMYVSNKRKDIVANMKTKYVKDLIRKLDSKNRRYICFTNSIKQLEWLKTTNSFIHSKRKGKDTNTKIIEDFNNGKYNSIFTVKMLTESANLTNIQEGIIIQLDKGKLTAHQRLGRVLRAYIPIMHIFVMKDTMDMYYYKNSIEDLNKKFIKYYEITAKK